MLHDQHYAIWVAHNAWVLACVGEIGCRMNNPRSCSSLSHHFVPVSSLSGDFMCDATTRDLGCGTGVILAVSVVTVPYPETSIAEILGTRYVEQVFSGLTERGWPPFDWYVLLEFSRWTDIPQQQRNGHQNKQLHACLSSIGSSLTTMPKQRWLWPAPIIVRYNTRKVPLVCATNRCA